MLKDKTVKTLAEAFLHTQQNIYYAETPLTKALPNVAKAAGRCCQTNANSSKFPNGATC